MKTTGRVFLRSLKTERQEIKRKIQVSDDLAFIETLTYRMELINLLILSMRGIRDSRSLRNLNHRSQF